MAYLLDWELLNLLIVMMSTQLYTPSAMTAPQAHPFTAAILEQKDLVPGLLQVAFSSVVISLYFLPYRSCHHCAVRLFNSAELLRKGSGFSCLFIILLHGSWLLLRR